MYRALARAIGAARLAAMRADGRVIMGADEANMVNTAHLLSDIEQTALLRYVDDRLKQALSDLDVPGCFAWLGISTTLHDALDHQH